MLATYLLQFCRMSKNQLRVFLGQENFLSDFTENSGPQIHKVRNIFVHPDFRSSTSENDIGILELQRDIAFRRDIKPICLPGTRAQQYVDDFAVAVGKCLSACR